MSSFVFPALRGRTWDLTRSPLWKTRVHTSLGQSLAAQALQATPMWVWDLKHDYLSGGAPNASDVRTLVGFFNAHAGRYDSFLFTDPTYNTVTGEFFGSGDGTTRAYQLLATFQNAGAPGAQELVQNLNGVPSVYVGGVLKTFGSDYTIGPTGIMSFTVAPAALATLTWSGSFFYRCQFVSDKCDVHEFMFNMWNSKSIKFKSRLL